MKPRAGRTETAIPSAKRSARIVDGGMADELMMTWMMILLPLDDFEIDDDTII